MQIAYHSDLRLMKKIERKEFQKVADFAGVDVSQADAYVYKWNRESVAMFDVQRPENFYLEWKGEIGVANLFANVRDQCRHYWIYRAINKYLKHGTCYLDYGCGSAAISFQFVDRIKNGFLIDVENIVANYIRWRIKEAGLERFRFLNPDETNEIGDNEVDFCLCIDVLEHLRNPSKVFILKINPKLKSGAILILQAPWGNYCIGHLVEAQYDWKKKGGKKGLAQSYHKVARLPIGRVSGVFRKK